MSVATNWEYRFRGAHHPVRRLLSWVALAVAAAAVVLVVSASWFVGTDAGAAFLAAFPAVPDQPPVPPGFPLYVRLAHAFNLLFMIFIIRSGLQILVDHPRLYTAIGSTPGSEWLRFRGPVPTDRLWTAKDDALPLSGWIGIPGRRHTVGLARHWHFAMDILFVVNGAAFVALNLLSGQWARLVPTTWEIVPQALSGLLLYASLQDPSALAGVSGFERYNALQQLTYFGVVFALAPLAILTGIAMSPAFDNRFRWYQRLFGNRQIARSLHFLIMCCFVLFIVVHIVMVIVTGLLPNLNHITIGTDGTGVVGFWVAMAGLAVIAVLNVVASPLTWRYPRALQHVSRWTVGIVMDLLFDRFAPRARYSRAEISPYFWPNGLLPTSDEWTHLAENGFRDYRLRVVGLVENPVELTVADLVEMGTHQQITMHNCIQGWSGIAEWGGLPLRRLIELVRPLPDARYLVFRSFGEGGEGGQYYDSHTMADACHPDSLLAHEMNYAPLSDVHGAPLRLRVENQLGFKQVKWIRSVEFVASLREAGEGEGGYNEDHEFYGYRAEI
ncbi:MAG: molybdopterin-dependent oxidoreductase [Pseudonocardia sp.]|nr:molybdopterin-dependent oxidoreductase [Pseudonocardia sp.]